jgi:hypothetical protein
LLDHPENNENSSMMNTFNPLHDNATNKFSSVRKRKRLHYDEDSELLVIVLLKVF